MPVHLIILSDVRLYREGLALKIASRAERIKVVATCADAEAALRAIGQYSPAVVVVDIGMPDGLVEVRRIGREAPDTIVLALALAPESDIEIVAAAEAGIGGYIPPEASLDDLVAAVEHAARGEMLCTPRVAGTLVRRIATLASRRPSAGSATSLTARELEVMELLDIGLSNKQIARRLSIRLATVKNHVHSILAKLNVKKRGEAVAAIRGEPTVMAGSANGDFSRWNGGFKREAAEKAVELPIPG